MITKLYTGPSQPSSESGTDVPVRPGSISTLDGGQLKLELVHSPLVPLMPHPIEELTSPASWALVRSFAMNVPKAHWP